MGRPLVHTPLDRPLTDRQQFVLDKFKELAKSNGYSPTFRQLAKTLGVTTKGAYDHVHALVRKGKLKKQPCPGGGGINHRYILVDEEELEIRDMLVLDYQLDPNLSTIEMVKMLADFHKRNKIAI